MVAAAVGVPHCRIWVLVRPARFVSIARTSNWLLPVSLGRACLAEWPDPLLTWGMPIVCHALQHADLSEREVEATVRDYRAAAHPPAEGLEQPDGGERHAAAAAAAAAGGGSPEQDGRRQAAARPLWLGFDSRPSELVVRLLGLNGFVVLVRSRVASSCRFAMITLHNFARSK